HAPRSIDHFLLTRAGSACPEVWKQHQGRAEPLCEDTTPPWSLRCGAGACSRRGSTARHRLELSDSSCRRRTRRDTTIIRTVSRLRIDSQANTLARPPRDCHVAQKPSHPVIPTTLPRAVGIRVGTDPEGLYSYLSLRTSSSMVEQLTL